jgi:APA family basic amino acid/polyamine antiporter
MGQLILMGVGGSIGAGIFVLTGVAAIDTGPAVVISYLFAGSISVLDALCEWMPCPY